MSIFGRISNLFKSNVNALIDKAEDPEKMLEQLILDMQKQLREAKQQVASAIADEKRLRRDLEKEKSLSKEWERKAMLAVKAGKDDLAKQALHRKGQHEKTAIGYEKQWSAQKQAVDKLKGALTDLDLKIEDAKRRKNLLVARAKRAEAQQSIAETLDGLSTNSASETMARMEEKVEEREAEAEALSEMQYSGMSELDNQFAALEDVNTEDALAELKAKMGVSSSLDNDPIEDMDARELEKLEQELQVEVAAEVNA